MKILIALHEPALREVFAAYAEASGHQTLTLNTTGYLSIIERIETEKPQRVFMDINYGRPGAMYTEPLERVAQAMTLRSYDTQRDLLGVSDNASLVTKAKTLGIPVIEKHNPKGLEFLS